MAEVQIEVTNRGKNGIAKPLAKAGLSRNTLFRAYWEEEKVATIPLGSKGPDGGVSYEHCFVGSFLTSNVINFPSMKMTLANVWHPIRGISIFDLNEGRYLFRLCHKVDVDRIEAGGPWSFNSHLLVMHRLRGRADPMVPLVTIDF
ncbi:hypothetical protein PVK06_021572 [Gossypium arboreum]|uniref:DUF4283 domain-containing protein n=1 Tax=Gossypium arboreum TaxID=29729 RepID=A0ABR0PQQ8_GOSAR|nr:hypothetical protein PVK06_021572 [Gossypium arboreum]